MPARGILAVSKEKRGPSLTVESSDLLNLEARISLDVMVILKIGRNKRGQYRGR